MDYSTTPRAIALKHLLSENLKKVKDRIAQAAARVGRDPNRIQLVAVTKMVELETIRTLLELGQADIAESRVQQLIQRSGMLTEQLSRRMIVEDQPIVQPRWHMIGHLQRNKVKPLLPIVELIHSVDTLRLAEEVSNYSRKLNKIQEVLIEVNCSGEEQKFGIPVAAVGHLIEQLESMPNIRICGLMTMAEASDDPEKARPCFERLYELFLETKLDYRLGSEFQHLSMGMSQDYEIAVECGATIVRVGSALFEGTETLPS
jgi:pyridoxal phosphate enzyme (YggS family)